MVRYPSAQWVCIGSIICCVVFLYNAIPTQAQELVEERPDGTKVYVLRDKVSHEVHYPDGRIELQVIKGRKQKVTYPNGDIDSFSIEGKKLHQKRGDTETYFDEKGAIEREEVIKDGVLVERREYRNGTLEQTIKIEGELSITTGKNGASTIKDPTKSLTITIDANNNVQSIAHIFGPYAYEYVRSYNGGESAVSYKKETELVYRKVGESDHPDNVGGLWTRAGIWFRTLFSDGEVLTPKKVLALYGK